MRVAEALAEITLALTPCDSKYATTLSARREDKSMLLAMPARCRPDRLVLGIAVDDDLGVLQTLPPASARRRAAAIQFRQKKGRRSATAVTGRQRAKVTAAIHAGAVRRDRGIPPA